jgi:8-oxo-dGTP diphosphatase
VITVIAAIVEMDGRILLAQRKKGTLAGKWEFPGGKLEVGETPEQCLIREMMEEFGVQVEVHDFFCSSTFPYEHGTIELFAYRVTHLQGEFVLYDHQAIQWVTPSELSTFDLSDADIPIAQKLWNPDNL